MVRLTDLTAVQQENLEKLDCQFDDKATPLPPMTLANSRVALVSSAGLMQRQEPHVPGNSADYRTIEKTTRDRDLLMNHISVNFDRSGFAEDVNCVLPRERLTEMAELGTISSVSDEHYSFMGATAPAAMKDNVARLVSDLQKNKVNVVCLLPV